jgi:hypothetical protein
MNRTKSVIKVITQNRLTSVLGRWVKMYTLILRLVLYVMSLFSKFMGEDVTAYAAAANISLPEQNVQIEKARKKRTYESGRHVISASGI